jgi:hypothetical protein
MCCPRLVSLASYGEHTVLGIEIHYVQSNEFRPAQPNAIKKTQNGGITGTVNTRVGLQPLNNALSSASFSAPPRGAIGHEQGRCSPRERTRHGPSDRKQHRQKQILDMAIGICQCKQCQPGVLKPASLNLRRPP